MMMVPEHGDDAPHNGDEHTANEQPDTPENAGPARAGQIPPPPGKPAGIRPPGIKPPPAGGIPPAPGGPRAATPRRQGMLTKLRRVKDLTPSAAQPKVTLDASDALKLLNSRTIKFKVSEELERHPDMIVMTGEDRSLRRSMAFKFFCSRETDLQHDFVAEAQIVGQLQHSNISPVYEIGTDDSHRPYAAFGAPTGLTLGDRIEKAHDRVRDGNKRLRRLIEPFLKACDAIAYAHDRGVLHRALNPHAIQLGRFGEVWVADWAFAQLFGGDERDGMRAIVPTEISRETMPYLSPEQLADPEAARDEKTDIFALGAIFYEVLTGRPPYATDSEDQLRADALVANILPPHERAPDKDIPRELADIAMRALSPNPEMRFASVGEFRDAIDEAIWTALAPASEATSHAAPGADSSAASMVSEDSAANALDEISEFESLGGELTLGEIRRSGSESDTPDAAANAGPFDGDDEATASERPRTPSPMPMTTRVLLAEDLARAREDAEHDRQARTVPHAAPGDSGTGVSTRSLVLNGLTWPIVGRWAVEWAKVNRVKAVGVAAGVLLVFVLVVMIFGGTGDPVEMLAAENKSAIPTAELDALRDAQKKLAALESTIAADRAGWLDEYGTDLKLLEQKALATNNWAMAEAVVEAAFQKGALTEIERNNRVEALQNAKRIVENRDAEKLREALARIAAAESNAPDEQGSNWPARTDESARAVARDLGVGAVREAIAQLETVSAIEERVFLIQFLGHMGEATTDVNGMSPASLAAEKLAAPRGQLDPQEMAAWVWTAARLESATPGSIAAFDEFLATAGATFANVPPVMAALARAEAVVAVIRDKQPLALAAIEPRAYAVQTIELGDWLADTVASPDNYGQALLALVADESQTQALSPRQMGFVYAQIGRLGVMSAAPMLRDTFRALPAEWLDDAPPEGVERGDWQRKRELAMAAALALAELGDTSLVRDLYHRRKAAGPQSEFAQRTAPAYEKLSLDGWGEPETAGECVSYARALLDRDRRGDALPWLDKAVQLDPRSVDARGVRAELRRQTGDLRGAVADYSAIIAADPNSLDAYLYRGMLRQQLDGPGAAMADYDAVLKLNPTLAVAWHNRGAAKQAAGDFAGAIADYTRAMELGIRTATAYLNRGLARRATGDLTAAIADFTRAIQLDAAFADAYLNRGIARLDLGDLPAALADISRTLELRPESAVAISHRGAIRRLMGDLDGAKADAEAAIARDANLAVAYFHRALLLQQTRDLPAARANYDRAISLDRRYAPAFLNRGLILQAMGKNDLAMGDFNRAIELAPEFADAFVSRGALHSVDGRPQQAMADYERAIELQPTHWQAWANRGFELARAGRSDEANEALSRALRYCPPAERPIVENLRRQLTRQ